ncbi:MAG: DUF3376 domain-containing protein [Jatrophihabitantaceae bacterium]
MVLNGGVSLAIWMGGVTHELNLVRLASRRAVADDPTAESAENAVVEVWKEILELAERRVEVDIIAGTSAGGLNGALLAAAIARGTSPPHMGRQWAKLADLTSLADPPAEGVSSLLNGKYFEGEVKRLLTEIRQSPPSGSLEGDCTLLITATALGAPARTRRLEGNQQTSVTDSRRVYRFTHWRSEPSETGDKLGDSDDFADVETLTRAVRASASFPVAFEQVWETPALYDRRVTRYLADNPTTQQSWLMDGGVLDNAPFEPLLAALLDRPVSAPFERTLLYVTPSVGKPASQLSSSRLPDIGAVAGAILEAVREPDQRLDDDALRNAFRLMGYAISRPHHAIREFLADPGSTSPGYLQAAENLFSLYQRGRNEALERQFAEVGSPTGRVWRIPDAATMPPLRPGIPKDYPQPAGAWSYGLPVAARILRWWGRALVAALDAGAESLVSDSQQLQESLRCLGRAQRTIAGLKTEYHACAQAVSQQPRTEPDQIEAMQAFYDKNANLLYTTVQESAGKVAACFAGVTAAQLVEFSVAVEIVSSVHAWGAAQSDVPRFRYVHLTPASTPIVEGLEDLKDLKSWPKNKLRGERLQHFGAFASEAGRWYDWTWGRLDGASALFHQILAEKSALGDADTTQACDRLRRKLAQAILAAEQQPASDLRAETERVLRSGPYDLLAKMPERNATFRVLRRNAQALVRGSAMSAPVKFALNRLIGTAGYLATTMLTISIAKARVTSGLRRALAWPGRIFRRYKG